MVGQGMCMWPALTLDKSLAGCSGLVPSHLRNGGAPACCCKTAWSMGQEEKNNWTQGEGGAHLSIWSPQHSSSVAHLALNAWKKRASKSLFEASFRWANSPGRCFLGSESEARQSMQQSGHAVERSRHVCPKQCALLWDRLLCLSL